MIPYIGGKSALANWVISNFPKEYEQMNYCEVFGGGGWILFKKNPSSLETYNDLNKHLVNLFKVIRDHYDEFQFKAEWSLHSREMYSEAISRLKEDEFFNEVDGALHYAINKMQSFAGGNFKGWGYQVNAQKVVSGKWAPFLKRLQVINARLKKVQIECLDFEKCITKYDTPNTLFYLDPPYYSVEQYYNYFNVNFTREDHKRLADLLKNIKGKFVLSYYEHEEIRKLYEGYNIISKESTKACKGVTRNAKTKEKPKSVELLIRNY